MVVERPLRILQVNTWDVGGGAAKVAWDLFAAYRLAGYSSWLAVGRKYSSDPDVLRIPPNREFYGAWSHFWWGVYSRSQQLNHHGASLLSRLARSLAEPVGFLNYYRGVDDFHFPGTARLLRLAPQRPTIVHGHNLHGGYFDLRMLPWLSRQVPVVLTLHDAWLLSGHCAHSFDCERWMIGCGHCPDLTIDPPIRRDATRFNWWQKHEIYTKSRLYVATPSQWLMRKVERSMLAPAVVEARVVPNGVDLSIFHPADRRAERTALGLPQEAGVLLFAANSIRANMWKDFQTLRDAVALAAEYLDEQRLVLIALGEDAPRERVGRAEVRFVPYQEDPEVVASYYQAADVYVHAARADTFPNTVLEALACGTPVVSTAVGGISEQIEDTRTGFLVPVGDATGLATRLVQVLSNDALKQRMGLEAAESARHRFDLQRQIDTYLQWYRQLIEEHVHDGFSESGGGEGLTYRSAAGHSPLLPRS